MNRFPFDPMIEKIGGTVSNDSATDVAVTCIVCKRKNKMYVSRVNGMAICFRCGFTASAEMMLVRVFGKSPHDARAEVARLRRGKIAHNSAYAPRSQDVLLAAMGIRQQADTQDKCQPLPDRCTGCVNGRGYEYLLSRGVEPVTIQQYRLMYCDVASSTIQTRGHVVFPDYDPKSGELRYWTTRSTLNKPNLPKSYNVPGKRSKFLFGEFALIPGNNFVLVVEGPMDMLATEGHGVALLGSTISDDQVNALARMNRNIIVCLDGGEYKKTLDVCRKIAKRTECSFTLLPEGEDPCSFSENGIDLVSYVLRNSRTYNIAAELDLKLLESSVR